jgi:hypothetical protein
MKNEFIGSNSLAPEYVGIEDERSKANGSF